MTDWSVIYNTTRAPAQVSNLFHRIKCLGETAVFRKAPGNGSAFGVAEERADDAVVAAVLVTGAQRIVLRGAEAHSFAPTMTAARISAVDGESGTGMARCRHDPAGIAVAFTQRAFTCRLGIGKIVGSAVGTTIADRQSASSPRSADGDKHQRRSRKQKRCRDER